MAQVKFFEVASASVLNNRAITNGCIYVLKDATTETGQMYADLGGVRYALTPVSTSTEEIVYSSTEPSSTDCKMWIETSAS